MKKLRFILILFISTSAFAQNSINSHTFSFSNTLETVQVEDALGPNSELAKHRYLFRVSYDFVNESLIGIDSSRSVQQFTVVKRLHTIGAGAGWMLIKNFLIGFEIPVHYVRLDQSYLTTYGLSLDPTVWKLGDIGLHAKWRFTSDDSSFNAALMPYISFPTGSDDYFISDDSYAFGGKLLVDTTIFHILTLYGNAGYTFADNAEFLNIDRSGRIELAFGAYLKVIGERLGFTGEVINGITVPDYDEDQNPIAVRLGFRAKTGVVRWYLGGGLEGVRSARSNDVSLYAGMKMPFGAWEKKEPQAVEPKPEPTIVTVEKEVEVLKKIETLKESLSIQREINFETAKDIILEGSYAELDSAANIIKEYGEYISAIMIEGHTDSRGDDAYNMDLSQRRANSVRNYLINKGIPADKLKAIGYGETKPKVEEVNPETRLMNRRVEFKVDETIQHDSKEVTPTAEDKAK